VRLEDPDDLSQLVIVIAGGRSVSFK